MNGKETVFFKTIYGVRCHQHPNDETLVQVVLLESLRYLAIHLALFNMLAGHPSQTDVLRGLIRTLFWPQVCTYVNETDMECNMREKHRARLTKNTRSIQPILATKTLRTVSTDILGPLWKRKRGHSFNILISDLFSELT